MKAHARGGLEASEVRRLRIVELARQGVSRQAVAERMGCSVTWVAKILAQAKRTNADEHV